MFSWAGLELDFRAEEAFRPPAFLGSMLRGALGAALKRGVCVMRLRDCTGCPLEHACIYTTIFETRPTPGAGLMRLYDRAPHPFVIVAPLGGERSETGFRAGVRLFGDAIRAAPFVLRAFEEAAARGFGVERRRHHLVAAAGEADGALWRPGETYPLPRGAGAPEPWPDHVRLRFPTPLRLKRDNRLVTPEALDGPLLAMSAVRRYGLLAGFFGGGTDGLDFTALKAASERTRLTDRRLVWRDLFRRSSRQDARLGIGGIMGEATLDLADARELAPILAWAPLIHVGKGASMGLGQVEAMAVA